MQQYTTLSTREKMLELHRQGVKAPTIAKRFGKSPMTVYRLIDRLQDRAKAGDHECSSRLGSPKADVVEPTDTPE
jgi:transposase